MPVRKFFSSLMISLGFTDPPVKIDPMTQIHQEIEALIYKAAADKEEHDVVHSMLQDNLGRVLDVKFKVPSALANIRFEHAELLRETMTKKRNLHQARQASYEEQADILTNRLEAQRQADASTHRI